MRTVLNIRARGRPGRPLVRCAALLVAAVTTAGAAQAASENADWPCIQRLVPSISTGQVWAGPEIEPNAWAGDDEVEDLAADLAARRLSIEDARAEVDAFAETLGEEERDARLTALFGRTLQLINRDRASLVSGIKRFAESQRALAERIRSQRVTLAEGTQSASDAETLREALIWEIRVYDDRHGAMTYLCEQPVLLEQRAFALGSAISGKLSKD